MARVSLVELAVPVLWIRYSGLVTLEKRRETILRATDRAFSLDCFRVLIDYRNAQSFEDDPATTKHVAELLAARLAGRDAKLAWLMRYDYQLVATIERHLTVHGIPNARFRCRNAAFDWLQSSTPQQPVLPPAPAKPVMPAPPAPPAPPPDPAGAIEITVRAAGPGQRMGPGQFAEVVALVEDLMRAGLREKQIVPIAARMLRALDEDLSLR